MLVQVLIGGAGLDGALGEVEVDLAPGCMPNFLVAGLPDAAWRRPVDKGGLGWTVNPNIPNRRHELCCGLHPGQAAIRALAEAADLLEIEP